MIVDSPTAFDWQVKPRTYNWTILKVGLYDLAFYLLETLNF